MKKKRSVGYPVSEELHVKIKIRQQKGILWKELGGLFVSMSKHIPKKLLVELKETYPLAFQFVEEIP